MLRDFSTGAMCNGFMGMINEQDRKRSNYELSARIILNAHPIGAGIDASLNAAEFYGHRTSDLSKAYYDQNIMNHSDKFERCWDSYKRATDYEYSGGDDCSIF